MNSRIFKNSTTNSYNEAIISDVEKYLTHDDRKQIYLLTSPLGEKYSYEYEEKVLVLLVPKHKIIFVNLTDDLENFGIYYDDFIEDLSAISDKYRYKEHIGRPRDWKQTNTTKINLSDFSNIQVLLDTNYITDERLQRISDLLISLLIGSINDISKIGAEVPKSLLERVKKNIILFDGEQTRFIYQDFPNKSVTIQGLSGTGKTELLLHKLKDLYTDDDNCKVFFTCHSIALANTLRSRIPSFFNFMKVEKQIEWDKQLWVNRAWGSRSDKNSGFYSYLCRFYGIPFLGYGPSTDYKKIFSLALEHLNSIDSEDFNFAFDYILIDERQDFPEVFFEVCKKVVKNKVFIAGDIFQDIYETFDKNVLNVDVILNKCYRTDPRTLMFAHAVGLGLFEKKRYNWFDDEEWRAFGYIIERPGNNEICLSREPLRRFEDIDSNEFNSIEIVKSTIVSDVVDLINQIRALDDNITANDIAVILLDDNKNTYDYIDALSFEINKRIGWKINRAHENKIKIENALYVSNPNNVKGLEFPYVICITGVIKNNIKFRNILYTMLTRSFIKTYLLLNKEHNISELEQGLEIINENFYIKAQEPSTAEKEEIKRKLITFLQKPQKSYKEFLKDVFDKLKIEESKRSKIEEALLNASIQRFDEKTTIMFIESIKAFY